MHLHVWDRNIGDGDRIRRTVAVLALSITPDLVGDLHHIVVVGARTKIVVGNGPDVIIAGDVSLNARHTARRRPPARDRVEGSRAVGVVVQKTAKKGHNRMGQILPVCA